MPNAFDEKASSIGGTLNCPAHYSGSLTKNGEGPRGDHGPSTFPGMVSGVWHTVRDCPCCNG